MNVNMSSEATVLYIYGTWCSYCSVNSDFLMVKLVRFEIYFIRILWTNRTIADFILQRICQDVAVTYSLLCVDIFFRFLNPEIKQCLWSFLLWSWENDNKLRWNNLEIFLVTRVTRM